MVTDRLEAKGAISLAFCQDFSPHDPILQVLYGGSTKLRDRREYERTSWNLGMVGLVARALRRNEGELHMAKHLLEMGFNNPLFSRADLHSFPHRARTDGLFDAGKRQARLDVLPYDEAYSVLREPSDDGPAALYRIGRYRAEGIEPTLSWAEARGNDAKTDTGVSRIAALCRGGVLRPPANLTGVARAYWLCCKSATEEEIVLGYRAYFSSAFKASIAPYMVHPLPKQLALSVKAPAFLDWLETLPWKMLEPIATNREVVVVIAAHILSPQIASALSDGPKRPILRRPPTEAEIADLYARTDEGEQLVYDLRGLTLELREEVKNGEKRRRWLDRPWLDRTPTWPWTERGPSGSRRAFLFDLLFPPDHYVGRSWYDNPALLMVEDHAGPRYPRRLTDFFDL